MPRDGALARERMRTAAIELYSQQGFEATTTAQIAERAGVTERTYFRHFADKREVLFSGEEELTAVLTGAVEAAPEGTPPLAILRSALIAAVPLFVAGRPVAERRAPIVAAHPALRERAQAKSASLADALSHALTDRGVPSATARFAAAVGLAAFSRGSADWSGTSRTELENRIDDAFTELHAIG